jgi:excisionase family DNA binding protein
MLKVSQLANRLNLSISKTYALIEKGEIGHHRLGGAIRISEEQLQQFLSATKRERGGPIPGKRSHLRPRLRHVKF